MSRAAWPDVGVPVVISPLVRRVLAPNPSALTGRGTNTYLVGARPPFTVVDPGPPDDDHLRAVLSAAPDVGAILVTHTHGDHAPGAAGLAAATGAPVCGFGPMLRPGVERHDDTFQADRPLVDGDAVDGVDHRLVALHTPGHASNHLCFLLEDSGERLLLAGDHVMQGSTVVIAPLDGDMAQYLAQLERIRSLGVDRILPGHGDPIDDPGGHLRDLLAHRAARAAKVLAALAGAGPAGVTCRALVELAYDDVPAALHPMAVYSTWAILRSSPAATSDRPDAVEAAWRTTGSAVGSPEQG